MSYLFQDLILKIFITENFKHVKLNSKMALHVHTIQLQQFPTASQCTSFICTLTYPRLFGDRSQILFQP